VSARVQGATESLDSITCFCVMERDFAAMDFQQFVCAQWRNISKKVWVMFSS